MLWQMILANLIGSRSKFRAVCGSLLSTVCVLILTTAAPALGDGVCSVERISGSWGYTWGGTIIRPTGEVVSVAAVGKATFDTAGNFEALQVSSSGGTPSQDIIKGTYNVATDCTGVLTVGVYDKAGNLLRKGIWALVFDDNASHINGLFISLTLPDNTNLPVIATMAAKKQ